MEYSASVKVCDALCGFGKTSACINMMNERTEDRFIFVTQFLTEVERIKKGCASRDFVSPESDASVGLTKLSNIHHLMWSKRNIATTHALFTSYTEETKRLIQEGNYILVLDEVVDVLSLSELVKGDMDILRRSNTIEEHDGVIEWIDESYSCEDRGKFREEMLRAKSKNLLRFEEDFFFWSIPPELFTCFKEVYVLTYLFQAQPLKCFFDIHNVSYEVVGVRREGDVYHFCDIAEMNRAVDLREKVHILENSKINAIGEARTSLSLSWYKSAAMQTDFGDLTQLRKNIANVFKNVFKAKSKETMWTTFKECEAYLKGRGYQNNFIPYNMRASNKYADRKYLAYCVNNFPRPLEGRYYYANGSPLDGDMYALSILVQWLFRSAIRKGEEVWIYVPSERMRTLLHGWLENLAEGRDMEPVHYKKPRKSRAVPGAKRGRPTKTKIKENTIEE